MVSRYGLVAFASSLDQIGVFARRVQDAATLVDVISGFDPKDSTSVDRESVEVSSLIDQPIDSIKIGVPEDYLNDRNNSEVNSAIQKAIKVYEELGATTVEISLPLTDHGISTYYVLAPAEASSNLARFDGIRYGHRTDKIGVDLFDLYANSRAEGFGEEVKRRIMLGTYALSSGYYDAYYLKAQKVRTLIIQEFKTAFERYDAIVSPTTPTTAFKFGEKIDDPLKMYLNDIFTMPANIAGIPAISIPCGLSDGLPVGLQIMGDAMMEEKILQIAFAYEQANEWSNFLPRMT